MAFVKKTWKDRIVQYANRRLLTKSGGVVEQVTVTRDEGTISEAGDKFDATTMNDLENRIDNAIDELTTDKLNISDWIKEGSNYTLNDMRTRGLYCGTFSDSPVSQSVYGFVIVSYLPNSTFVYQQFVGQKWNGDFGIYARTSADANTWNSWKPLHDYKTSTANDLQFYRKGDVVYFTITSGTFTTNSSGIIVINGSTSLIPQGYRPPANCQMWETNLGCRMAAQADGSLWCARTSQSGLALRVSGCWVTTNNMP